MDLSRVDSLALLRMYADILTTLNRRTVLRTRNAPAGDLAEYLTAAVYEGTLASQSKASWDVEAADGRLLQVKSLVVGPGKSGGNFSPFRSWGFDAGVFVLFDSLTYGVTSAIEVPATVIEALTTPVTHVGATARRVTPVNLRKAAQSAEDDALAGGPPSPYRDQTSKFAAQMLLLGDQFDPVVTDGLPL